MTSLINGPAFEILARQIEGPTHIVHRDREQNQIEAIAVIVGNPDGRCHENPEYYLQRSRLN